MIELELNLDKRNKNTSRFRILLFTAITVFILTTVQNLGFKGFNLLSPLPFQKSALDKILPNLEKNPNNFKIKKTSQIVQSVFASDDKLNTAVSSAFVAMNFDTGEVILQKNMDDKLPIASLTKIMTAVVALDLNKPSDEITISKQATEAEPTKIGVVENQRMKVEELLDAALLTSANDAVQALKDSVDNKYNEQVFVNAMNAKAKFIGLENTNFSNPQGFDSKRNYSTAVDLANLTHYALTNYPLLSQIVQKDYQFLPGDQNHKQFDLYNWNGLLDTYPGVRGVKIGNTDSAGYTTVVLSEREGKKVLVVLLGATGVLERDLLASQILDNAFQKISEVKPAKITKSDLLQKYSTWKYWN